MLYLECFMSLLIEYTTKELSRKFNSANNLGEEEKK